MNKIESRKRILKASRKLFSTQGYEDTMIEEIARRAKVSKATVYNYFPNKESLLIGIVDEVADRVEELLETNLDDCPDSLCKLRRVLEEIVEASLQYPSLSRRIAWLHSDQESTLFGRWEQMTALLKKLILASQGENLLKPDADADEILDVVMGVYLIALFQWAPLDIRTPGLLHNKLTGTFDSLMRPYFRLPAT
ncbi:MAG: TetR/AcrR family transcriptional regulator [Clostridiaceae bacterium]|nr:TetR/AcrR family transcriptional regulator [Clostridiaceae bacterium]